MIKNFRVKLVKANNRYFYEWIPNNNIDLGFTADSNMSPIFLYNIFCRLYATIKAIGEIYGHDKVANVYDKLTKKHYRKIMPYIIENYLKEEARDKLQFDKMLYD